MNNERLKAEPLTFPIVVVGAGIVTMAVITFALFCYAAE
jgi:hypothetical protein